MIVKCIELVDDNGDVLWFYADPIQLEEGGQAALTFPVELEPLLAATRTIRVIA